MIVRHMVRIGLLNKIEWLKWGQTAFDKARSSGKPILLDITGSWCHWCHVMDETSYSDPAVIVRLTRTSFPSGLTQTKDPMLTVDTIWEAGSLPLSSTAMEE